MSITKIIFYIYVFLIIIYIYFIIHTIILFQKTKLNPQPTQTPIIRSKNIILGDYDNDTICTDMHIYS